MAHKICKALAIYKLELDQKKLQDSLNLLVLAMSLLHFCWDFSSSLHCKTNILG